MQALTSSGDAPMSRERHRAYRVTRVVPEGRAGVTLILDEAMPAQPGQFAMAWLPGIEERPFSLMDDDPASLTVADVGPFTSALCTLEPGIAFGCAAPMDTASTSWDADTCWWAEVAGWRLSRCWPSWR